MNASYDIQTDTLTIVFKPGQVAESDQDKPNIIMDYDALGGLISMEILDASKHIPDVTSFQFIVNRSNA